MKYSFNFCHGSRTVGFSTSTIFVEARPPARLLTVCSTSRRCARRIIQLSSGGIGARCVRTNRNDFSVTFWQRVRRSSSASRSFRPREPLGCYELGRVPLLLGRSAL